jgi:hypothetical protein
MSNNSGFLNESTLDLASVAASCGESNNSPSLKQTTLQNIIDRIKSDPELRRQVQALRDTVNPDERKRLKQALPFFNLGTFQDNLRKNEGLLSTQFMVFDYDHVESIATLRNNLRQDPSLLFCFTSPSGDGLKAVYRCDREITSSADYSTIYKHYASAFTSRFGEKPDHTQDAARATFFSSDPDLLLNDNAIPLSTECVFRG